MAREINNTAVAFNRDSIPQGKRATGFLNISLPNSKGGYSKLYGIPLVTEGDPKITALVEMLQENPEATCEKLLSIMKIDYRSAEKDPGNNFKLD